MFVTFLVFLANITHHALFFWYLDLILADSYMRVHMITNYLPPANYINIVSSCRYPVIQVERFLL